MKKFLGIIFMVLLTVTLVAGVAASLALAAPYQSGYSDPPYWYTIIDSSGNLTGELDAIYQNSAQYTIFLPLSGPKYILSAHPNYRPASDDQTTAQTTTLVTNIQSYNQLDVKANCAVAGTFQVASDDIRVTTLGIPYLKFSVTFSTYNAITGALTNTITYDPAYFNLNKVM
jgi:hypothetical protein